MYSITYFPISPNKLEQNSRSRRVTAMEANILPINDRMETSSTLKYWIQDVRHPLSTNQRYSKEIQKAIKIASIIHNSKWFSTNTVQNYMRNSFT